MPIGRPESFRGGQGFVEWLMVAILVAATIAAVVWWRT